MARRRQRMVNLTLLDGTTIQLPAKRRKEGVGDGLTARDFVAVQGIVVLLAIIVAVTNFIVDVLAALIDPRVRY